MELSNFTPENLRTWRTQASDRLMTVLTEWDDRDLDTLDYKVDELVRKLNGKPARPADRKPYESLYPGIAIAEARKKAGRLTQQKVAALTETTLQPIDDWLDETLRVALNKSDRLPSAPPYIDLISANSEVSKDLSKDSAKNGPNPSPVKPPGIHLSIAQLTEIASYADPAQVERLYPYILRTLAEFELTTPLRQAHFLAQLCHESGSFNYLEELASGEDYEGRDDLGNVQEGDGVRFKGRGLIQITGRTNYGDCGEALGVDLIAKPERLAEPDLACRSAGWFWNTRNLSAFADRDDVDTITYRINGGYNGYDERVEFLHSAKSILEI
jgi:putative chitinase